MNRKDYGVYLMSREVSVIDLESYILYGDALKAETRECGNGKVKVILHLKNGESIETPCVEDKVAKKIMMLAGLYNKWSNLINQGGS